MFFPVLENLNTNNNNIRKYDIDLFDWWLGTRRRETWNYLNPLQFSIDCDINESIALNLFAEGTINENVKLFEMRSILRCPSCSTIVAKEYNSWFPKKLDNCCLNCEIEFMMDDLKEEVEIYFALLKEPLPPSQSPSPPVAGMKEKAESLGYKKAKEYFESDNSLSKLFSL